MAAEEAGGKRAGPERLRVEPIRNGTVIDHITSGQALNVLRVLRIDSSCETVVSLLMNVGSEKMGRKDIVKVEDRELSAQEAELIALLAPQVTINIIRQGRVTKKFAVDVPDEARGVLRCPNPNCITNSSEPLASRFRLLSGEPITLGCDYCGTVLQGSISDYLL